MQKALVGLVTVLLAGTAYGQYLGPRTYPQFRSFSALPGGGFGVTKDGRISAGGTLSFSSPIAYSLKQGRYVLGGGFNSKQEQIREFKIGNFGTTAWGMGGIDSFYGSFTISGMILSSFGDSVLNAQFTPNHKGEFAWAVGFQDLFGNGGSGGTIAEDKRSSFSPYAVGTYEVEPGFTLSGGIGIHRFSRGFANASYSVNDRLAFHVEHDGFNFNGGVGFDIPLGMISKRDVAIHGYVGMASFKFLNFGASVSF